MCQFHTIEKLDTGILQHILTGLQELDRIYRSDSLEEYEQTWQSVEQQVQQTFPGFTIAYAEIHNAGSEREAHGGMRHVLLPIKDIPPGRFVARK